MSYGEAPKLSAAQCCTVYVLFNMSDEYILQVKITNKPFHWGSSECGNQLKGPEGVRG